MENKELINEIKNCKTIDELITVSKDNGYELTKEEAKAYFDKFNKSGELTDDELSNVTGGCTWWRNGKAYSGKPHHYLIVTCGNSCPGYSRPMPAPSNGNDLKARGTCPSCGAYQEYLDPVVRYCSRRSYYHDPYNPYKPKK